MAKGEPGQPWTDAEIDQALDVYFTMLALDLEGKEFVKSEYREQLEVQLPARSKKSIELKWCNISAVLDEGGLPWLDGFKPLSNYQRKLKPAVGNWLQAHRELSGMLRG